MDMEQTESIQIALERRIYNSGKVYLSLIWVKLSLTLPKYRLGRAWVEALPYPNFLVATQM